MSNFLEAQNNLTQAKEAVRLWTEDARLRRHDLALAIQSFQVPISREQLMRAHVLAEKEQRQKIKDGLVVLAPPPRLASPLDRQAFYGAGGGPEDHVRGQFRNGGHRRGSMPGSMKNRIVKPPSER